MATLLQDLRYALRMLRKSPGFTFAAVITLALGIGANAVVFGLLDGFILRPLRVPHAESLWGVERGPDKAVNESYPDYLDLRDRNHSFQSLAAYNVADVGIDTGNNPAGAWSFEVTGNYFDVLEIKPYLGRFFHSSDEHGPNSAPYIVLNYNYWHTHFEDDRNVVGRTVLLNKHPFTVIGVAPPEFQGTLLIAQPDVWVPLVDQQQVEGSYLLDQRGTRELLMTLGHLKPGVTRAQAADDLNTIGAQLEKSYPNDDAHMTFTLARPSLAGDWLGGPVRAFLTGLMLLAGLILLAACANLGSLFAARAADRSREMALRLALGSSRRRILRALFTEALMVSLVGGALGMWGSYALLRWLSTWQPLPTAPVHLPVSPDASVLWFSLAVAVISGFLFGMVPVRQVLRANPYEIVKAGASAATGRRLTARDILLVAQIAICAVLVTASLVAVRGLMRSLHSNLGFEPRNATLVESTLTMGGYTGDNAPIMQKRIIDTLKAVPGVAAVGSVDRPPLYYGANSSTVFSDHAADLRPSNAAAEAMLYNVSPEYFAAAQTTLLAGRDFTWHDDKNAPRVAVVNQQFARKLFGSVASAVGGFYKLPDGTRVQVVGVVEDGKYAHLAEDPQPAMFLPSLQSPRSDVVFVVRSARDAQPLIADLKAALHKLDPSMPFFLQLWPQELESALFGARMATFALGVLGLMGAMLSITGIFGMAAYAVSKRMRELGIRVALGAARREVLQAALGRALKLLAIGSLAGLILGILASRVLASIVYQATPRDPLVLAAAVLTMLLLGLLATWIPAQRALAIDPMVLLREE